MDKIKQKLKELGLSDEQIAEFIKETINDKFIPKHRMDEVNEKNKQLTEDISNRDKQIKELSKFEGDNATLKAKVEELEAANKQKDEANAKAITELKVNNAINFALSGKVQDGYQDLVTGLIDKNSIILKEDGTISGLQEQLDKIKKDKALLFVAEDTDNGTDKNPNGWSFKGHNPDEGTHPNNKSISENFVQSLLSDAKTVSESTGKATEYYFGNK